MKIGSLKAILTSISEFLSVHSTSVYKGNLHKMLFSVCENRNRKGLISLTGVNKVHLPVYHETVRYYENKSVPW